MTKITLDRETFKALASDTRLDILKTLDGKNMGLNEIAKATNLNKATLHEHLGKLHGAGLIKRNERDGHKWVYYKLTWKGESLLHPENTRIVVLFTTTFVAVWIGIIQLIWYIKGTVMNLGYNIYTIGNEVVMTRSADAIHILSNGNTATNEKHLGLPNLFQNLFLHAEKSSDFFCMNYSGVPFDETFKMVGSGNPLSAPSSINLITSDNASLSAGEGSRFVVDQSQGMIQAVYQNPLYLYVAFGCFILFTVILCVALWRLWENRTPKI